MAGGVGRVVELQAAKIEVAADRGAQLCVVFTDAGGESEDVTAVERDEEAADVSTNRGHEDLDCGGGVLVAGFGGGAQIPEIARVQAGHALETGVAAELFFHFGEIEADVLDQVDDGEDVEVAGAIVLRKAALRGHAPARIDHLSIARGADGGRTAEVAGDDAEVFRAAQFGGALGHEAVARAMETGALDIVFLLPLDRDGKTRGRARKMIEKRRFERPDARQLRIEPLELAHRVHVGRVVRGEERIERLHRAEHAVVENLRARDALGHDGLEADGREFAKRAEHAGVLEEFLEMPDRVAVSRKA